MFIEAASAAIEKAGLMPTRSMGWSPFRRPALPLRASKRAAPAHRISRQYPPCSGFRPRLRGRGQWPSLASRLAPCRSRQPLAVRHCRNLLDFDPARQRRPGGRRRHRPLRRRRRRGGRDQRRAQPRAHHRLGRETVARHAADHGLGRRRSGPCGGVRPRYPAVHRGRARRRRRGDVRTNWGSSPTRSTGCAATRAE